MSEIAGYELDAAVRQRMRSLYRAASVRAIDARTIERAGVSGIELMERAARSAWRCFNQRWPMKRPLAVLCGPGNNGGDGFLFALAAYEAGWPVEVFALEKVLASRGDGDAARALARLRDAGVAPLPSTHFSPQRFSAVADALFGTGLTRAPQGEAALAISAMNAVEGPRVALDIPSGLAADTGSATGECVRADLTVTFIAYKQGLFTADGPARTGEVVLESLAVPTWVYDEPDAMLARADARPVRLPPREPRDHKGRFGHVLVVGGDRGFAGAASLAAQAAARVGSGLVSVATRAEHVPAIIAARPELMVRGVDTADELNELLHRASVVAIGPGLGTGHWGKQLLAAALSADVPMVADADALNAVSADATLRKQLTARGCDDVITPHPGEASRLLDTSTVTVESDRFTAVTALARTTSTCALLKGGGTLVATPGGAPVVCDTGHPAMASGGMGDVLTGTIAGLMAQGLGALEAAIAGALVHGEAARRQVRARGIQRGLLAADLLAELPVLASAL